ncbi:Aldehyde/histidinol dehydrogenase [Mycena galopus ATCC 62051]|nr:Aldehyde/histidinol dehydrogenase [Mycena galopus ATCC 62051]
MHGYTPQHTKLHGRRHAQPGSLRPRARGGTLREVKGTSFLRGDDQEGEFRESKVETWIEVLDPTTTMLLSRVPEKRFTLELQALIRENQDTIATAIVASPPLSNRKLDEYHANSTQGDVLRGLHVGESACVIPTTLMGEKLEVNKVMNIETRKVPLASRRSTPSRKSSQGPLLICMTVHMSNGSMIHLWTILLVLVTGNTLLIKPSACDPGATMIIAERLPPAHPTSSKAQSPPSTPSARFVGGNNTGRHIYTVHSARQTRAVQHRHKEPRVVMSDAKRDQALNALLGAACGAAEKKCMAISVAVFIGAAQTFIPELVARAGKLKGGGRAVRPRNLPRHARAYRGPHRLGGERQPNESQTPPRGSAVAGWRAGVPRWEFCGIQIEAGKEGLYLMTFVCVFFGPVLCVRYVPTLDAAIPFLNTNPFGNGAAVFTRSGAVAQRFEMEVEAGQIEVNVLIPVPLPMFSWTGNEHHFILIRDEQRYQILHANHDDEDDALAIGRCAR